jgi:uncharacterized SAM-dependent methyltransferase
MIVGFPPFYTGNNNNSKMYELIKKKPVYFPDPQRHQIQMSKECQDFISQVSVHTLISISSSKKTPTSVLALRPA